ncbi:MAG: hypothetical protein U0T11_07135 [Chitinophagaceae bacterium]
MHPLKPFAGKGFAAIHPFAEVFTEIARIYQKKLSGKSGIQSHAAFH